MDILYTAFKILLAIFFFGIIIFVHELGHFMMAKWNKVRVLEFAIGMGPKLFSFGKGNTKYTLRLFPIGGFCAMEGEDPETPMPRAIGGRGTEEAASEPLADTGKAAKNEVGPFNSKPVWRRILVIVAGAVMNLILGFVLLIATHLWLLPAQSDGTVLIATTRIHSVDQGSQAEKAGLRAGDEFRTINGRLILSELDMRVVMGNDTDAKFDIKVARVVDGKAVIVPLTVQFAASGGVIDYGYTLRGERVTIGTATANAARMEASVALLVWNTLGDLIRGNNGLEDLSGPVGTIGVITDTVDDVIQPDPGQLKNSIYTLVFLITLITVNVGVFNLLPFPGLDGGRLVFLIYEGIFRKPVSPKYEGVVHLVGLALLMLLMLVLTFNDVIRLF